MYTYRIPVLQASRMSIPEIITSQGFLWQKEPNQNIHCCMKDLAYSEGKNAVALFWIEILWHQVLECWEWQSFLTFFTCSNANLASTQVGCVAKASFILSDMFDLSLSAIPQPQKVFWSNNKWIKKQWKRHVMWKFNTQWIAYNCRFFI